MYSLFGYYTYIEKSINSLNNRKVLEMPEEHLEDQHAKLDQQPFDYQTVGDDKLLIFAFGKLVRTLKGEKAKKLISKINEVEDEKAAQLILAKATGYFKRGNERRSLDHEKDGR